MKRTLLLIVLLSTILSAKVHSFKEIEAMPKSISKDYFTWRFLQDKKTSKAEALKAYKWTLRKTPKLKKAIRKKVGYIPRSENKHTKRNVNPKNYIIYPASAANRSRASLKKLYAKIQKQGKYSDVLKVMSNDKPFEILETLKPQTQCYIFNHAKGKYRKKRLNKPFSKKNLQKLIEQEQFNKSIHLIVTTPKLDKIKASLVDINITKDSNLKTLSFSSRFLLAMNAVEFSKIKEAQKYLELALKKAKYSSQKDQSNFWLYLLTKDKKHLKKLLKSTSINIYTLRARDILKKPYLKVVTPKPPLNLIPNFDLKNPIDWEKIKIKMKRLERKKELKKLHKLADKYNSSLSTGIYSFLKEKADNYQKAYYPMPYIDGMIGFKKERIALLYAIGRQESRFVPASISTSYALGMMQIMPFLIKHLAKERKEKLDLDKMFDPYVAISYANQHLNYLNKKLYHPLFVAYAYNGGIGFTRRTIRSKHMFKSGKYEPYLSMELVDYEESKQYGKKVLTNYVVYMNLLGKKIKITPLLDALQYPKKTDKYRK